LAAADRALRAEEGGARMWSVLFGWVFSATMVLAIIGTGWAVLSMSPPQYTLAQAFFTIGALLLISRTGWWIIFESGHQSGWQPVVFCFVVFGGSGSLWYAGVHWVQGLRSQSLAGGPSFHESLGDQVTVSLGRWIAMGASVKDLLNIKVPFRPRYQGLELPVSIYVEDDNLYVDGTFAGPHGQPLIKIQKNQLSINTSNGVIDKNCSDNAIEVVAALNDSWRVIFQLVREGPDRIVIKGGFPTPNGVVIADDHKLTVGAFSDVDISPIFKYPSWKYRGVYAESSHDRVVGPQFDLSLAGATADFEVDNRKVLLVILSGVINNPIGPASGLKDWHVYADVNKNLIEGTPMNPPANEERIFLDSEKKNYFHFAQASFGHFPRLNRSGLSLGCTVGLRLYLRT
jgi:hypothetical protein